MKQINLPTLIIGLILFSCNQADKKTTSVTEEKVSTSATDKEQIQNLIRQVLNWADTKNSIDLLPTIADNKNIVNIGFDLTKHKQNLDKLRQTNFFATEFIENYNQIILTLDKGLRNGNYDQWLVGDLPTFIFANDVDPWTLCQDVPYDKPNPFDFIEVKIINADNGKAEANWHWGKLELNADKSWKDFSYKFKVVKENDKWKIAYLTGFDFKESTRKDGQL
jgi:hypothetical protein